MPRNGACRNPVLTTPFPAITSFREGVPKEPRVSVEATAGNLVAKRRRHRSSLHPEPVLRGWPGLE